MFFKKQQNEEKAGQVAEGADTAAATPAASAENGSAAPTLSEEAKKRAAASKRMAASLGEIVALLMRAPSERHHALADLEWLIVPAIMRGQFVLAEAQSKDTGVIAPVGAVLWAHVSPEVDQRLSDLSTPLRLKPEEWRSGDIPWIMLAAGDTRVIAGLIQKLTSVVLKGRQPKMRVRGPDGKVTVGHLEIKEKAQEPV